VGVTEDESTLLVLTAASMMRVYVDMDLVAAFDPGCVLYVSLAF
jgi:hypothetical protein